MSKKTKILIIVAVVVLLAVGVYVTLPKQTAVGTAVDCSSNTCFTSLGVTGTFQTDGAAIFNGSVTNAGAITNSGAQSFTSTVTIGSSGTALNNVKGGLCYLKPYATTIAATTTAIVDCQATQAVSASGIAPLTGVQIGDATIVSLATSTANANGVNAGLVLAAATASTTNGYIQLRILNLTGTTFTWPTTGNASGTASYMSFR